MKKLIVGIVIGMALLTGCTGIEQDPIIQESLYNVEQENRIVFSDLEEKFQDADINFARVSETGSPITQYSYGDENGRVTILISPDYQIINEIIIESEQDLSRHPLVKILAPMIGEEKLLTWLAEQEGCREEFIQDILVLDRNYIYFECWPGYDSQRLEFIWVPKPHIPMELEEIAQQLEDDDLLTTSYIEGIGGQTLTATNLDYYYLTKMRYKRDFKQDVYVGQAATYKVMQSKDTPSNYSLQLYGYMKEDLSYKTKVEKMPGLHAIIKLMNMDQEDFVAITKKINQELTKARELQNYNLQREYYVEGDLGGYHYTIMVPEGIGIYTFTVLIEKI